MNRRLFRTPVQWLAAIGLATPLGFAAGKLLRATEAPARSSASADGELVRALGGPTGVLAVVNPVNCALTAKDAAALNALAAVPGVRVTVLLLAVPARDSMVRRIRHDFGFSPRVVLAAAATVNPDRLPELFRMPFIAVLSGGQLRHAAWGQSLKGVDKWLPTLIGVASHAQQLLSAESGA